MCTQCVSNMYLMCTYYVPNVYLQHDARAKDSYPRLNRTLWIIVERLQASCTYYKLNPNTENIRPKC